MGKMAKQKLQKINSGWKSEQILHNDSVKPCYKLPREAVDPPSFEIFRKWVGTASRNSCGFEDGLTSIRRLN